MPFETQLKINFRSSGSSAVGLLERAIREYILSQQPVVGNSALFLWCNELRDFVLFRDFAAGHEVM